MSSFAIRKGEYIKVAGVVSAMNDQSNFRGLDGGLYLGKFDNNGWHLLTTDEIESMFIDMYNLNAKSVQLQYGDKKPESDDGCYTDEFNEYYTMTRKFILSHDYINIKKMIFAISQFARSVNYQIEDEQCNADVMNQLNDIIARMCNLVADKIDDIDCWGKFNYYPTPTF